jgi:hypothetical protein
MTELRIESPLRFPEGWQRTPVHLTVFNPQFAQNISIAEALKYLQDEVSDVRAHSAILYTNYNGLMNERTRSKQGQSEGATLELGIGRTKGSLACDKWRNLAQNLYALHLAVRHLRMFEEWGIATPDFMLAPFDRRKAAQETGGDNGGQHGTVTTPEWMEFLGLGPTATLHDANAIYRYRAKRPR